MRKVFIFSFLFLFNYLSYSQTNTDSIYNCKLGVGLQVYVFRKANQQLPDHVLPVGKLMVSYNINKRIRLEPEIGLYKFTRTYNRSVGVHYGLNTLWLFPLERTIIFTGIVLGYDELNFSYETVDNSLNVHVNKTEGNRITAGAKIGAEYFINKYISLAGDVNLLYGNGYFKESEDYLTSLLNKQLDFSSFTIQSNFVFRFYIDDIIKD